MKTGNASRRIISLSDEIKALKLRTIQDQRQHVILREENRRLGAVITSNEAVLTAADCARIEAETRLLVANSDRDLAVNQKSSDTPRDDGADVSVGARAHAPGGAQLKFGDFRLEA